MHFLIPVVTNTLLSVFWFLSLAIIASRLATSRANIPVLCLSTVSLVAFALASANLLTNPACWLAVGILSVCCIWKRKIVPLTIRSLGLSFSVAAIIGAAAFMAWPGVAQPPTDGDTLIYHLPNASLFIVDHGFWQTLTRYWWYPPGSELITASTMIACGRDLLPSTAFLATVSLGVAVFRYAAQITESCLFAAAISLALITSHVVAVQGGDMQNDVILAAVLAALSLVPSGPIEVAMLSAAGALIKPSGFFYVLAASSQHWLIRVSAASLAIALVWIRNAILMGNSLNHISDTASPGQFGTSIAAHGLVGIQTLFSSTTTDGISSLAFLCLGLVACASPKRRITSLSSLFIWWCAPFSFESGGIQQLAIGSAIRFGLPTFVLGAAAAADLLVLIPKGTKRNLVRTFAAISLVGLTAQNILDFRQIYISQQITLFLVALCAAAATWFWFSRIAATKIGFLSRIASAIVACSLTAYGLFLREGNNTIKFYSAALARNGQPSSLPAKIFKSKSSQMAAVGFSPGVINAIRPDVRVFELPVSETVCHAARRLGVEVFARLDFPPTRYGECEIWEVARPVETPVGPSK